MAQRRMFSKSITESDGFLAMGTDVQNLYFHLGMQADDDGFVSPRRVMRMIGSADDSLNHLVARGFVIPFETGVVVITSWKENNYIQADRYKPTVYSKEMASLDVVNGMYTLGIQNVRAGKVSIGEDKGGGTKVPLLIVEDSPKKEKVKRDATAFKLREKLYDSFEKEKGVRPTPNMGDYIRVVEALKRMKPADVETHVEDMLTLGKVVTVRESLSARNIDYYLQNNV